MCKRAAEEDEGEGGSCVRVLSSSLPSIRSPACLSRLMLGLEES